MFGRGPEAAWVCLPSSSVTHCATAKSPGDTFRTGDRAVRSPGRGTMISSSVTLTARPSRPDEPPASKCAGHAELVAEAGSIEERQRKAATTALRFHRRAIVCVERPREYPIHHLLPLLGCLFHRAELRAVERVRTGSRIAYKLVVLLKRLLFRDGQVQDRPHFFQAT